MSKSIWTYERTPNGTLAITDIGGISAKSVTNDIENVLLLIDGYLNGLDLTNETIIYRDSDGLWSGVACKKEHGEYRVIFIPIPCTSRTDAVLGMAFWKKNIGDVNLF